MRRVAMVGAGMTPFAERSRLGIKDLIPMAYAEASPSRQGHQQVDIEAAWFGELSTTNGFPSELPRRTLDLTDIPVTRVENACATGNDAIRNGTSSPRILRRSAGGQRRQGPRRDHVEHHVLGLGGDDP